NIRLICSHSTRAISEKPEIGLAAGGDGATGAAANADDVVAASGGAVLAAGLAGVGAAALCARLAFRLLANCDMICAAVAWIMPTPRPYWATAPESDRSVCTSTLEPAAT